MRRLRVEVVYALCGEQALVALEVEDGTTIGEAVERSGILSRFPDIGLLRGNLGVFGRLAEPDVPLRDGDRVEIYRPLIADPKQARQARARRRR